jgi:geranylgeranyl pyrophosphate synthase
VFLSGDGVALTERILPANEQLGGLLNLHNGGDIGDLLATSLLDPLREFLSRPSKRFRSRLVELGYRLAGEMDSVPSAGEPAHWCAEASLVLEALHAGSLVVDDIEDSSQERRGAPALHLRHGLALALNAGNWLYFWPFEKIRKMGLPAETEVRLHRVCHEALLRAHFGQALDVGVFVDELPQQRIPSVCLASLELKTGALTSLAARLGAVLGGADDARLALLDDFGRGFGMALQMFDDIGNLRAKAAPRDFKQYEDLKLRRPSFLWAVAAESYSAENFAGFAKAVAELPNAAPLEKWMQVNSLLTRAKTKATEFLAQTQTTLRAVLGNEKTFERVFVEIAQLSDTLRQAYD